jgi:hypothetical protein
VSEYRTLKISLETVPDLSRALWLAEQANAREGIRPLRPEARTLEALSRMIREWSSVALTEFAHGPEFDILSACDWRCACGATGLNAGGLVVSGNRALCRECAAREAGALGVPRV